MSKLEKLIKEKSKELSIGQSYLIKATKYKAGLMIIDIEDLHEIINKMRKDFEKTIVFVSKGSMKEQRDLLLQERTLKQQWVKIWVSE